MTPRIPPLTADEMSDEQRELTSFVDLNGPAGNIFGTLVRHPGLFRKWLPFGGKVLSGKLPARDREILILRTAYNCRTDYEFGQHVVIAKADGLLTDHEIHDILNGTLDPLLIRAADELHNDSKITDETWAALAERYDEPMLIEIPFVVGQYHLVAFALNSFGVQREEGVPGFPDKA